MHFCAFMAAIAAAVGAQIKSSRIDHAEADNRCADSLLSSPSDLVADRRPADNPSARSYAATRCIAQVHSEYSGKLLTTRTGPSKSAMYGWGCIRAAH